MDLYTAAKEQIPGKPIIIEKIRHLHYTNTGLYGACEVGNLEFVKLFVEKYGAWDINNGIYYACVVSKNPDKDTIEYLSSYHGRLMIKDEIVNIYKYKAVAEYLKNI
jgi:hypothetical protein